ASPTTPTWAVAWGVEVMRVGPFASCRSVSTWQRLRRSVVVSDGARPDGGGASLSHRCGRAGASGGARHAVIPSLRPPVGKLLPPVAVHPERGGWSSTLAGM